MLSNGSQNRAVLLLTARCFSGLRASSFVPWVGLYGPANWFPFLDVYMPQKREGFSDRIASVDGAPGGVYQ